MIIKVKTDDIKKYGAIRACLLGYMREFQEIAYFEAAADFGMSPTAIAYNMDILEQEGVIEKRKGDKGVRTLGVSIKE